MNAISSTMSESLKKAATAALIALVTASISLPVSAQQAVSAAKATAPAATPAAQSEEEETAAAPKKPGQEGIKVHGHWVMDLKDKDGKVIAHRDFQNSLSPNAGPDTLIYMLSGILVPSNMEILASHSPQSQFDFSGITYVMQPASNHRACTTNCSNTFTQAYTSSEKICAPETAACYNTATIVLNGSFTASATVSIDTVSTGVQNCVLAQGTGLPIAISPAQCNADTLPAGYVDGVFKFTSATITPLSVAAGQTLAITVTLSFS
jgi:hypothetical protein